MLAVIVYWYHNSYNVINIQNKVFYFPYSAHNTQNKEFFYPLFCVFYLKKGFNRVFLFFSEDKIANKISCVVRAYH